MAICTRNLKTMAEQELELRNDRFEIFIDGDELVVLNLIFKLPQKSVHMEFINR